MEEMPRPVVLKHTGTMGKKKARLSMRYREKDRHSGKAWWCITVGGHNHPTTTRGSNSQERSKRGMVSFKGDTLTPTEGVEGLIAWSEVRSEVGHHGNAARS